MLLNLPRLLVAKLLQVLLVRRAPASSLPVSIPPIFNPHTPDKTRPTARTAPSREAAPSCPRSNLSHPTRFNPRNLPRQFKTACKPVHPPPQPGAFLADCLTRYARKKKRLMRTWMARLMPTWKRKRTMHSPRGLDRPRKRSEGCAGSSRVTARRPAHLSAFPTTVMRLVTDS